jgi:hypothetical protein
MADFFAGQNWLITPAPLAVNEHAPSNISEQKFLAVLSGVYVIDRKGTSDNWRNETIFIGPDGAAWQYAVNRYNIPRPVFATLPVMDLELWTPYVALGGLEVGTNNDVGVSVNVWRPWLVTKTDVNGHTSERIFNGIEVDIAVRDTKAILHRLSYHVTVQGTIRFVRAELPPTG